MATSCGSSASSESPSSPSTSQPFQIMDKPGGKSVLWEYFGLEKGRNGRPVEVNVAICRSCFQRVAAKNGNTSNLLTHLRTHHPLLHVQVKQAMNAKVQQRPPKSRTPQSLQVGQSTIQETLKYDRSSKRWKDITNAITYFICKDSHAIYMVEKSGFRRLMKTLDSRYEVPSRSYFSKTAIPQLYSATVDKVKGELSTISYFSSTTDLWSSHGMVPYMSYTIHFIDDCWKLKTRCLHTQFLPQDHTGENIAEAMEATLDAWSLSRNSQVCLTTDNGTNIINATGRLKWLRLSCFGHNLHLAITNAIKNDHRCSRAVGVCHKVVSAFSQSWKRKREFKKAQTTLGLKQHSLVAVSYITSFQ